MGLLSFGLSSLAKLFRGGGGFLSKAVRGAGGALKKGVFSIGNKVFGSNSGRKVFQTAADYAVNAALNQANTYGKRFANSDFVRNNAAGLVPQFEKASEYLTDKLRKGYNGTMGDGNAQGILEIRPGGFSEGPLNGRQGLERPARFGGDTKME